MTDPLFPFLVLGVAIGFVSVVLCMILIPQLIARRWARLPVGTRSLLAGAHCWFLHPWAVARGWFHLYGWRRVTCSSTGVRTGLLDPRLWLAFIVHDWGYWGSPNMDGPEGEKHPEVGAWIAYWLFDRVCGYLPPGRKQLTPVTGWRLQLGPWYSFFRHHSRHLAKAAGAQPSLLCHADKASLAFTPAWIYVPMARLSGEIREYRARETRPNLSRGWTAADDLQGSDWDWYRRVREWCLRYAEEHRDGKADTWTVNEAKPQSGPTLKSVAEELERLQSRRGGAA